MLGVLEARKALLCTVLRRTRNGIQYVGHAAGDGAGLFEAVCKLGLEGVVSKKPSSPYKSGPSKSWIKVVRLRQHAALTAGSDYQRINKAINPRATEIPASSQSTRSSFLSSGPICGLDPPGIIEVKTGEGIGPCGNDTKCLLASRSSERYGIR
jgi:hypothetical protein